ncbi:hypothetical protein COT66_01890 [Candidatus Shapirobacteria bacterium CG09_land_8_20_14_0_10_49_15]|uniref:Uncharacterized protein n=2 Tax=Candidatus Shapironibacteriota TaxID=1752721 RepID=A0A2M8L6Q8_9BACT|nr:MAG: hypothetical protein COT66_01890 [Candidatus Shapirobacteria bacterium CG09_land_8_20_14_0_10_49_15]PJE69923.1 MAG: hypothetical protein COU97_02490 [Candidatus Shapirobacteria bacterium CG10_big_fil_rev_8_21_14_0_10_48_15]
MNLVTVLERLLSDPWIFLKILFLMGFFIYLAFAVIVVRQVKLMSQTLNGILDLPLKMIAWIHLLVAIGVFLLALIVL